MAYPITLTITTGRSGSSFLANSFRESLGDDANIFHEYLSVRQSLPARYHRAFSGSRLGQLSSNHWVKQAVDRLVEMSETGPVVDFGWTMSPIVPLLAKIAPERARILVLYRHPVKVAASFATFGMYKSYWRSGDYMISPFHEGAILTEYKNKWRYMSEFEKNLYRWYEITKYGFEAVDRYSDIPSLIVNSDKLFEQSNGLAQVAEFCGFDAKRITPSHSKNENRNRNVELFPIRREWEHFDKIEEVARLANELGFNFDRTYIESLISKHRLPDNYSAKLRYFSRYWLWRRKTSNALKGFLK